MSEYEYAPAVYVSPVPVNVPGMAPVRDSDGAQGGEVLGLPTFDELSGGVA
ncbi:MULTISPECIES: hypothetical protein [Streptosporangium]|uniref:Uncharacterized protein n=1 Tax=Streptosporangium brasiliense TaxID=47480 RepID=A0ABT9RM89_9ACTN|nr:hypothetical protein [Streptosporangium brasiliense]MDP9870407.1 hypothetical protein [Streptosporangium brasiliense]